MCAKYTQMIFVYLLSNCTELNINFRESDYVVNEGDQQHSIVLQLREVQNSFTMTLFPVNITGARNSAGFNVSDFVAPFHPDTQASPGKRVVPSICKNIF